MITPEMFSNLPQDVGKELRKAFSQDLDPIEESLEAALLALREYVESFAPGIEFWLNYLAWLEAVCSNVKAANLALNSGREMLPAES